MEKVREDLKEYAFTISANCRELVDETARLACFVEDLLKYRDLYDTSTEGMDQRYKLLGEDGYLLAEDANLFINATSGVVPLDDRVKQELRLFETRQTKVEGRVPQTKIL